MDETYIKIKGKYWYYYRAVDKHGDVTDYYLSPLTPLAQVVVYLEAIVGGFYMAIVVLSLVSSNIEHQVNKNG